VSIVTALREVLRRWTPGVLRRRLSPRLKARARALLGLEPWPDLAVRHRLFREPQYRSLRLAARGFDVEQPHKPVLERGHQTAYLVARWFADAGVTSAFHVGYANGRYLFYLSRLGIQAGGTDLPPEETGWTTVPARLLDEATGTRLLALDLFDLTADRVRDAWGAAHVPIDVLFSEATFETMLPWRDSGVSVAKYGAMSRAELRRLTHERLPAKLAELAPCFGNVVLIEPEPSAGGAGDVFAECARRLPGFDFSVWEFRPPLDRLFRLSAWSPTRQTVYAFLREGRLGEALGAYARPLGRG
jgi:hypothetical protein